MLDKQEKVTKSRIAPTASRETMNRTLHKSDTKEVKEANQAKTQNSFYKELLRRRFKKKSDSSVNIQFNRQGYFTGGAKEHHQSSLQDIQRGTSNFNLLDYREAGTNNDLATTDFSTTLQYERPMQGHLQLL